MKKKVSTVVGGVLGGALLVAAGVAVPAYAGDWAWGSMNCTPVSQYVYTGSTGTGAVTHNHYINGVRNYQTFQNGTVIAKRTKTFWEGMTTMASVSGAGTTYAKYYCG